MLKRTLISFSVFAILVASYGSYLYFKKPADTRQESADYTLSAEELVMAFNLNEDSANARFVDKILVVTGEVQDLQTEDSEGTVFLVSGDALTSITCSFYSDEVSTLKGIKKGDRIRVKGRCTGKLMDVVLNTCSILTTN